MIHNIPYAVTDPDQEGLNYLAVEISYGGEWIDLNEGERFRINGQNTRDSSSKTWRKITAQSPVLGGSYLVHAVPEMVTEQVSVWVHGASQSDLADNFFLVEELFEQPAFQMRWTYNEYREYWLCQLAEASHSRGQVWTHNQMALSTYSVPRYPQITRERIG